MRPTHTPGALVTLESVLITGLFIFSVKHQGGTLLVHHFSSGTDGQTGHTRTLSGPRPRIGRLVISDSVSYYVSSMI